MSRRAALIAVGGAGVLFYALAGSASHTLHRHFWTSHTMGQEIPWYFMGETLIDGVCAALALGLTILLGAISRRRLGGAVWTSLMPAILFLSGPVGRGLAVLVRTSHIWAGPPSASSAWRTFDEYLCWTDLATYLALGVAFTLVLRYGQAWSEGAAEQGAAPDGRRGDHG